jgi:hypothetical protein
LVLFTNKIETKSDETNDTKLNNKQNVQFIRKCVLPAPDYLDRFYAVDHWLPLVQQHTGFDLSSSQDDLAQIDHVTWGADGWTFKPMVVRIGSGFTQCPGAIINTAHTKHSS